METSAGEEKAARSDAAARKLTLLWEEKHAFSLRRLPTSEQRGGSDRELDAKASPTSRNRSTGAIDEAMKYDFSSDAAPPPSGYAKGAQTATTSLLTASSSSSDEKRAAFEHKHSSS